LKASSASPTHTKYITIICNPFAGRGQATKMAKQAELFATKKGWKMITNIESKYAGHIENELAGKFAPDSDLIILIGGDGTLRELIAGLRKHNLQTEIAFIPMGNANVVARELKIPLQPELALQMLDSSKSTAVDLGILKQQTLQNTPPQQDAMIFLAMLEIGFGAKIVHMVNQLRSGKLQGLYQFWGDLVYALAGFLAFCQIKPKAVSIKFNSKLHKSSHLVISNMKTYAKGWSLTPDADCQDGLLDISLSRKTSRLATIATFFLAAQKRKSPARRVSYSRLQEAELKGSPSTFIQVDGDPIHFSGYAKISIEEKAFLIHVPNTTKAS
jgi:diacylglycerol kinase (ATP)